MNRKKRRHSGRYTPRIDSPTMKHSDKHEDAIEPQIEYDDWIERRDGFRDILGKERKERGKKKTKDKRRETFINLN